MIWGPIGGTGGLIHKSGSKQLVQVAPHMPFLSLPHYYEYTEPTFELGER